MPTFIGFLKGEKVDQVVGADPSKIAALAAQCAALHNHHVYTVSVSRSNPVLHANDTGTASDMVQQQFKRSAG